MKQLAYMVVLFFYACAKQQPMHVNETSYMYKDTVTVFDLNKKEYSEINYNDPYNNKYKVDSVSPIFNCVKKQENYDDIFRFSKLEPRNNINVFTVYSYWDYYTNIILITEINKKCIDTHVISTISGDGEDFEFKKSKYKNGVFYSNFVSGEREFTTPYDTVHYSIKGTSKIMIQPDGKITEDTTFVKKNFTEVKAENDAIENDY